MPVLASYLEFVTVHILANILKKWQGSTNMTAKIVMPG